ncbi:unnamed protein product [Anisakis simplex]|uniref:Uncharacterized protein n=1 Tax=Anisakis simplex TaxID=6269 RepID=A0A3P6SD89_ANISI|nr:unnamed protein product [Anisakis simplex]
MRAVGGQLLGSAFILYRLGYCSREVASVSYLIRLLGATLTLVLIYHCSSMTPDLITNEVNVEMDESHELCARLMGAYFTTSYLISTRALYWKEESWRLIAIDTRALICSLILTAQIWSQYAYEEHWSGGHWVGISLFSFWTIIALLYRSYATFKIKQSDRTVNKPKLK